MFVQKKAAFCDAWNYIDIVVITTSVIDYVLSAKGGENSGGEMIRLLRIGRLLRLGRLFRSLKVLQGISWLKEQYLLIMMMASCMRALLWALILCFFMITLWSVL